jgi:hypothetical protein
MPMRFDYTRADFTGMLLPRSQKLPWRLTVRRILTAALGPD